MKKLFIVSFLVAISFMIACGGSDTVGGNDGKTGTVSYAGPGSVRKMVMDNVAGTSVYTEAVNETSDPTLTINYTFARMDSGFIKYTVANATGAGCPDVGTVVYGFEIPSMALLLKPMNGQDNNIIALVVSGTCPTTTFDANWIKFKAKPSSDASLSCNDNDGNCWFGTFKYKNGIPSLPTRYSLGTNYDDCLDQKDITGSSSQCSNGIMEVTQEDGKMFKIFLTEVGGGIVQVEANAPDVTRKENVIAFPQQTVTLADLAGEYYGLVFTMFPASGSDYVYPVGGTIVDTTMTGYKIDADTGVKETGTDVTFDLLTANSPSDGFIKVRARIDGGSQKMICQAATNVGPSENKKKILNCVSQDKNIAHYYNLMLVSK